MYGNNMNSRLPYEASGEAGPLPTTRRNSGHRYRRFHPYTDFNSGCYRNVCSNMLLANSSADYCSGFSTANFFPAALPANYFANCQLPGAGALLASALYRQEYPSFSTDYQFTNFPQTFELNSLQSLCDPAANDDRKFSDAASSVQKDKSHPFYWRKRAEPAEGMTRTRDKYRVVYTEKQRKGLENEYKTNKFITTERKAEISRELDLSERQIKIWFQNRRAKERRDIKKKKDIEQVDSENSFEDDTDNRTHSPNDLASATFPNSCRFEEDYTQTMEKTFSSGQCRYSSQVQSGCRFSNSYFPVSRESEIPRNQVSPTEFGTAMENSLIPALNVSPIMGNVNNDFSLRL